MKMTFAKAWNLLRQQKPQLFNFDQAPEPQTAAAAAAAGRAKERSRTLLTCCKPRAPTMEAW
jgi:hypothetical protein